MILAGIAADHAVEIDGNLVPYGRRLADLDGTAMLSHVYAIVVGAMKPEDRAVFDSELMPDEAVDDAVGWLPESLRGKPIPAEWLAAMRARG
jgi:hypothetical protein